MHVLYARSPPHIPEVSIPEELTVDIALSLRYEINRGLAVLREIASGRDLKKFLSVCLICCLFALVDLCLSSFFFFVGGIFLVKVKILGFLR